MSNNFPYESITYLLYLPIAFYCMLMLVFQFPCTDSRLLPRPLTFFSSQICYCVRMLCLLCFLVLKPRLLELVHIVYLLNFKKQLNLYFFWYYRKYSVWRMDYSKVFTSDKNPAFHNLQTKTKVLEINISSI